MQIPRKLLFIINPIAGTRSKVNLLDIIEKEITNCDYKIMFWESPDQDLQTLITNEINKNGFNVIVAVGGDGTVNKIASIVNNTSASLAIIPLGSGNGLARHLKIPIHIQQSLQLINTGNSVKIDSCTINNCNFFCTAGIGFDAHIGYLFSKNKTRGFWSYFRIVLKEYFYYKQKSYVIDIDENKLNKEAVLITFANANQWGNNAKIAPKANIQDGLLSVVIVRKGNIFQSMFLGIKLFLGNTENSTITEFYTGNRIKITQESSSAVHYDGEPDFMDNEIVIENNQQTLNVIVGDLYK